MTIFEMFSILFILLFSPPTPRQSDTIVNESVLRKMHLIVYCMFSYTVLNFLLNYENI